MRVTFRTKDTALWTLAEIPIHVNLRFLLEWILKELTAQGYEEVFWTSFFRIKTPGECGVHNTKPCRAADFLVVGMSTGSAERFAEYVNKRWVYGFAFPEAGEPVKVLMWHDTGRGLHFHAQVGDKTRMV